MELALDEEEELLEYSRTVQSNLKPNDKKADNWTWK